MFCHHVVITTLFCRQRSIRSFFDAMTPAYTVEALLAPAQFGPILLARDAFDRHVAIKRIHCRKRLAQHERAMNLRLPPHPHVVRCVHAFDLEDDVSHLVFEFCPHGDLQTHLQRHVRLPESLALVCLRQIVAGVAHAHRHGVAHRDLSPENIFLDVNLDCKVGDFGLAVALPTICDGRVGKPLYMAPEVYGQTYYDPAKADVWSLGALFFIMLTGVPIVDVAAPTDPRFCMLQAAGVQALLAAQSTNVSPVTVAILESMLTTDPFERISMDELVKVVALGERLQGS
ncbi:Aste57867_13912 [Aphanomyces stellatus]|uniref:Aste57867_13912 protein n=1 Tax=Aphanomyces stellatus TaxID=120398 RepID=A0A485KZD5_9STRA|nr:hypothetical protein As57867_013861 [Aphanomyces stellatus]VFT90743.1 Aste57867_13912 [Aphanomyces stellatus]